MKKWEEEGYEKKRKVLTTRTHFRKQHSWQKNTSFESSLHLVQMLFASVITIKILNPIKSSRFVSSFSFVF